MTTTYHRDFDRLCALLKQRGPIAFSMRLAQITGHPKDAVLLSQLVYWTRHGRDVVARQGWIHKTREQWFEETGLSREEQENARRRLRRLNLAQEWRGGRPARLYFRIHTGTLSAALSHIHQLAQPVHLSLDFMRGNEHAMGALFGPSVAFHRVLAEVTGSVNAALMLSRMIQLQRHTLDSNGQWFSLTANQWARDCGLKRRQFENAKHKLHQLGLIEEFASNGRHRRVFSRVHPVRLLESLGPIIERMSTCANKTMPASCSGRTAPSRNGASFVQTLDRRNRSRPSSPHEFISDSVQTLDRRYAMRPSPTSDDRRGVVKTEMRHGGRTCPAHDQVDDVVQTLDKRHDVRASTAHNPTQSNVQTPDARNGGRPITDRQSTRDFVKTLDKHRNALQSPDHAESHSEFVQTLDTRNGGRSTSVHEGSREFVQTLDTGNGGRPISVHEGGCDFVKTLDTHYCTLPSLAHAESRNESLQTLDRRYGVWPIPVPDRIDVRKSLTNFSQPAKLEGEKRTLQLAGFVHGSRRETYIANARAYTTTSTNTPTTTGAPDKTTTAAPPFHVGIVDKARPAVVVGQDIRTNPQRQRSRQPDHRAEIDCPVITFESPDLIWPSCVHAAEQQPIAQHLARVPLEDRQIMLDEMAGSHRHHPVKWPVAYVGSLVKRYHAGNFIPAKAHLERESRRLAAVRQVALREREEQFISQLPPVSSVETARHNLAALRDALRRQCGQSGGKRD